MRIDRDRAWARYAPAAALPIGALYSLAFAPFSYWPLGPPCLATLWWLWRDVPPRRAAWTGFAFGVGLFLAGTYWLYISIHGFGKAPIALALLLMFGLVAIMGSYSAALGWLIARYEPRVGLWRLFAVLPAGWVLMEWFRGWFLSGFPWLAIGYSEIDTPLAGYAPVVGIYGVSFLAALTAGALCALVEGSRRRRYSPVVVVAAIWAAGYPLGQIEWTRTSGAPLSVALVQGAIPQDLKWEEDNRDHTLQVYRDLTRQALGTRIIVWPESALPVLYDDAVPYLTGIYQDAERHGSDLVLGLIRYDGADQRYRNGLVALARDEEWYYKRRLVPFGEFFPVPSWVRSWMRLQNLPYVDFMPGRSDQGVLDAAGEKLGATICYEDAYGVEQLDVLRSATLLVNVSNDAWFGDSTAPHQHLQIARMRALEAGRWLMRATNNGVTAIIDPHGHVVARSRQFEPEVLKGEVVPRTGLTPYAALRNWPVLAICWLLLGLAAVRRLREARAVPQASGSRSRRG